MQEPYSWSDTREDKSYRLPGTDHLWRWSLVALIISILIHVAAYFAMDGVKIVLGIQAPEEMSTSDIQINQVEVQVYEPDMALPPEDTVTPPNDHAALLDQVDLLDLLPKDAEVDLIPDLAEPQYALKQADPIAEGELDVKDSSVMSELDLDSSLPEFGTLDSELKPAELGQVIIDPGSLDLDDGGLNSFTDQLAKEGNRGLVDQGKLEGIESLDQLLNLPANLLLSKKTLLPSDLLFEFNRYELRDSAKIGLMKLALLIDKNPELYCWIEGHSDLIGGEAFNLELSLKRAESVKNYLVQSMRMNPERIIPRGFGKSQPLILEGDERAQSSNRRVEVRMRKTPPTDDLHLKVEAPKAEVPKAILITPKISPEEAARRAIPVEEDVEEAVLNPEEISLPLAPKALPVEP